jgi:hypothetical protein
MSALTRQSGEFRGTNMPEYEYLNDALGVPGEVIMVQTMSRKDIIAEAKAIVDDFAKYGKLGNVPEGAKKQRLRELFTALGLKVAF